MTALLSQPNNTRQKAMQYLVAIIMILMIGKLITLIPVMDRLRLLGTFKAAELVWFGTKLSALVLFFYLARAAIAATPNSGGLLSFFQHIAEPLTILIIVIIGQELLWQVLEPFVGGTGKTAYFSFAVISIVASSIWLVFKAYQFAPYLSEAGRNMLRLLSRLMQNSSKLCTSCGKYIKHNAEYCSYCGDKILHATNCTECGKMLVADEKFCRYCGAVAHS